MDDLILKVENLTVDFAEKHVLNDLSFDVQRGDFLSIVGQNGVGKTTLVRVILGQLKPTSGKVQFVPNRSQVKIGYVPQFRNIDTEYPLSVKDFVALAFSGFKLPWLSKKEHQRLNEVLKETNLNAISKEPLGRTSGGEKQRAYLAQALVVQPDLLILDESTASLDPEAKESLLNVVSDLNSKHGLTVIFVTHDIPLAKKFANKYLFLRPNNYEFGPISNLNVEEFWKGQADV
ncbi:metal ABC transporter ATP-binding protein [Fructilactobacillus fructivorans]|uniref:Zinc ABC transporter, ATP-binding protein ZnuC n=1 Tax=Fructilactobacillus fructivorans TaxID=1614 RepID=A0A0C1M428_9LACO|nr:ABC transporter ATP-binding protein [Fructilactobacillus fructivorans]KID41054.1 Zinc ABC transporter, ATP-binding protein ZnuC [Fructilactobacillus fructivorans]MCT0151426.1 ABC transporter ATP-binding protein [Fructilactobacillus fructivorans]MCT2866945.1 ABC transporter ATP-binding protein [Fructilactobacillus fructivorans]MCT2869246.1 ABC transporter ATP-binding protein [Fructilactobacillus fructivorans]MCT2873717.1 ABC transporter ATP-binding protein [Fructilactobacillus fructivorans]